MDDLFGYRCLIAVNHLHDIPKNLEIAFGTFHSRSLYKSKDGIALASTLVVIPLHRIMSGLPTTILTRTLMGAEGNVLDKAMSRKAKLLEGASSGAAQQTRKLTRRKIKSKSILCGVKLSDEESANLRMFMSADV
uniref:Uncharacterized protein n=1 Tax=Ananas comosus var. bracteatus TaxID=296719 RepID=A0A6V7PLJ3_ANACO|nr:unnamed protein product [Ananas comosus var. bracteatus]